MGETHLAGVAADGSRALVDELVSALLARLGTQAGIHLADDSDRAVR